MGGVKGQTPRHYRPISPDIGRYRVISHIIAKYRGDDIVKGYGQGRDHDRPHASMQYVLTSLRTRHTTPQFSQKRHTPGADFLRFCGGATLVKWLATPGLPQARVVRLYHMGRYDLVGSPDECFSAASLANACVPSDACVSQRRQPYALAAAALCTRGCSHAYRNLQPFVPTRARGC